MASLKLKGHHTSSHTAVNEHYMTSFPPRLGRQKHAQHHVTFNPTASQSLKKSVSPKHIEHNEENCETKESRRKKGGAFVACPHTLGAFSRKSFELHIIIIITSVISVEDSSPAASVFHLQLYLMNSVNSPAYTRFFFVCFLMWKISWCKTSKRKKMDQF